MFTNVQLWNQNDIIPYIDYTTLRWVTHVKLTAQTVSVLKLSNQDPTTNRIIAKQTGINM